MRKQITRLQICQFSLGVFGGTYYFVFYFQQPTIRAKWPPLTYTEGCGGGELSTVMVGYVSNLALLAMFVHFYFRSYLKRRPKGE
mmetsp:Transcript_53868/g.120807  ORF Transcript_53868/g.120807 Transcript_53868/m.120807 type:complete len:85 (-) Transcript_53868:268-522(-)